MQSIDIGIYIIVFIVSGIIQKGLHEYIKKYLGYDINTILSIVFSISVAFIISYLYYLYGISYKFIIYFILTEILMAISIVDILYYIIRDRFIVAIFILGVINLIVTKNVYESIMGFIIAGGFFFFIAFVSSLVMGDAGIGGGDIKLIAFLGLLFGTLHIIYIILYTFIIGGSLGLFLLIIGKKNLSSSIPLAPSICFATIAAMTYLI